MPDFKTLQYTQCAQECSDESGIACGSDTHMSVYDFGSAPTASANLPSVVNIELAEIVGCMLIDDEQEADTGISPVPMLTTATMVGISNEVRCDVSLRGGQCIVQ